MRTHHPKHATAVRSAPTGSTAAAPQAVASNDTPPAGKVVTADDVHQCAYRKWESAGMPTGDGIDFWLQAEHELTSGE